MKITTFLSRKTIREYIKERVSEKKGRKFNSVEEILCNLDPYLCEIILTEKGSILSTIKVLDPAVGSGAFIIAAMRELIDFYGAVIGKIKTMGNRNLNEWLGNFKKKHKSIIYGIKKDIILNNLYGVDIMPEATEICKLRLFLSLVGTALETEELEPLPNIDFNIMTGDSLIGFLKETRCPRK